MPAGVPVRGHSSYIREAATDAPGFVDRLDKNDFLHDKRTQQAVIMSLIIAGEAATR